MLSTRRGEIAEIKSQGAAEAARDPNSNVSSQDAQRVMAAEAKKAGVQAFEFDPDASPEAKAAQARSVRYLTVHGGGLTDQSYSSECLLASTMNTNPRALV